MDSLASSCLHSDTSILLLKHDFLTEIVLSPFRYFLQAVDERVLDNTEETAYFDEDLIDIDALLDDDTFMPTAT